MTTRKTENDVEAAAREALGLVLPGQDTKTDVEREEAARKLLGYQQAVKQGEAVAQKRDAEAAETASKAAVKPENTEKSAPKPGPREVAAPVEVEVATDDSDEADDEPAEQLTGETFTKDAVSEIAARAYKRGASSKRVREMASELRSLREQVASMKRDAEIAELSESLGVSSSLLRATKLDGDELAKYAHSLAETTGEMRQNQAAGFESVRAAVERRTQTPADAWAQLAAALR